MVFVCRLKCLLNDPECAVQQVLQSTDEQLPALFMQHIHRLDHSPERVVPNSFRQWLACPAVPMPDVRHWTPPHSLTSARPAAAAKSVQADAVLTADRVGLQAVCIAADAAS